MAQKAMIVEDQCLIAEYFKVVLEQYGYEVCGIARTAREAVAMALQENPSIVLMDYRLPGEGDGVDAAIEICGTRKIPMIYITASREPATLRRIAHGHPAEIFIKPVVTREIADALARHCPLES